MAEDCTLPSPASAAPFPVETNIHVLVPAGAMLLALTDKMLRAELDRRTAEGISVTCTTTEARGSGWVPAFASKESMIEALGYDPDAAPFDQRSLTDTVKEIAAAVKAGDDMYFRHLLNRLAPDAVIV